MRQRSGPGFANEQRVEFGAQRKRTRGSNRPLLEPDPTGLPAGSALIVLERGPDAGSRFLLDQPVTSVGRPPRSDIFLDVTVSRRHVELRWEKDDFHVTSPGHSAANSVSSATAATKPPRRSRLYPSTDSGTIAEMDARSGRVSMIRSKRRLTTR
jgi:pSer/pThr/pTyr-binding forkhead associated (FHA) protein